MNKEQQDLAWKCLPKEVREEIKERYRGWRRSYTFFETDCILYDELFGTHNLTSDTEPSELLFVERKKVQQLFSSLQSRLDESKSKPIPKNIGQGHDYVVSERGFINGAISELKLLFGDKCLPDKEPKFKVGDLVKHNTMGKVRIREVIHIEDEYRYSVSRFLDGFDNTFEVDESELHPYTEPSNVPDNETMNETMNETKDNMEEKELNLYELLESCGDVEQIYSVIHDAEVDFKLSNGYIEFIGLSYYSNGSMYDVAGRCMLYPSRALYEKYPLDAYSAWMEWKSERTTKWWRAKEGEIYWLIPTDGSPIVSNTEHFTKYQNKLYEFGNYFRTEEEAQQAAEALKEWLAKFHEKKVIEI